jgi:SAM-dependent methyltransferase
VERAEEWALAQGCVEMASDTWAENEAGRRAHEALGFEAVDQCVNYRKRLAAPRASASLRPPLYGADLARVHDVYFAATAVAAADELLRRLAATGISGGTVVDLGTGSGILARRVLDAGFDVLGVDLSADMLELARSLAPRARFIEGSLWDVDLPPAVAVTAVGEAFNYSTETFTPNLAGLEERLTAVADALAPGGLFLFDVAGPGRSGVAGARQRFWDKDGTVLLMEDVDDHAGHLTRRIETFVPVGALHRRANETHRLVLFPPTEVAAALDRAGFSVERLDTYPGFPPLPGWTCFAASRRAP